MVQNGYKQNAMLCVAVEPAAPNTASVMAHAHRIIKEVRVSWLRLAADTTVRLPPYCTFLLAALLQAWTVKSAGPHAREGSGPLSQRLSWPMRIASSRKSG